MSRLVVLGTVWRRQTGPFFVASKLQQLNDAVQFMHFWLCSTWHNWTPTWKEFLKWDGGVRRSEECSTESHLCQQLCHIVRQCQYLIISAVSFGRIFSIQKVFWREKVFLLNGKKFAAKGRINWAGSHERKIWCTNIATSLM